MKSIFEILSKEQHQLLYNCIRNHENNMPPFEEALGTVPFSNGHSPKVLKKTVYRHGASNIYAMLMAAKKLMQRVGEQHADLLEELEDFRGIDRGVLVVETIEMLDNLTECFYPNEEESRSYCLDNALIEDYFTVLNRE